MKQEDFSRIYLRHEQQIIRALRSLQIYDEDRLHDTYIALYEHSQHTEILDFATTFVKFYRTLQRRANDQATHFIPCSPEEMVQRYDRPDASDLDYREQVAQRVDALIEEYRHHPFPGERNHHRAVRILQLYRSGLTLDDIGQRLQMSKQAVHKILKNTIKNMRIRHRERDC